MKQTNNIKPLTRPLEWTLLTSGPPPRVARDGPATRQRGKGPAGRRRVTRRVLYSDMPIPLPWLIRVVAAAAVAATAIAGMAATAAGVETSAAATTAATAAVADGGGSLVGRADR